MIVNDILNLIKFIKDFKKEGKDINGRFFVNFIEPLWIKFNEIHSDYKTSFKRYKAILGNEGNNVNDLIQEIKVDSLFSEDLRSELMSMSQNVPNAFPKTNEQLLDNFIMSLGYYFEARSLFVAEHNKTLKLFAPRWKNSARFRVISIINENNKEEIGEIIDETVEMLQSNHKWVTENFYKLKKTML